MEMEKEPKIEVSRIYKLDGDGKTKAFVDVSFDGFVIKGLRVVEGKKGLFVSMPRQQGKDGRWYNLTYPAKPEIQQAITEIVLKAYQT
ncbi:MAG: SpoVG family protein [Candidatus Omnitrophica bacterium]|nr:SpoVG family protein [Candidatus Omnitrophota bacterium]